MSSNCADELVWSSTGKFVIESFRQEKDGNSKRRNRFDYDFILR